MALTQTQLQEINDQITTELLKIQQIINGDTTTIIQLYDGSVVPSINKIIHDTFNNTTTQLISNLQNNLNKVFEDLMKNIHPVQVYQLFITSQNAGTFMQITLDDIIGIQKFMINGLIEPNDGSVFTLSGKTINIPPNDILQENDVITIAYFTND